MYHSGLWIPHLSITFAPMSNVLFDFHTYYTVEKFNHSEIHIYVRLITVTWQFEIIEKERNRCFLVTSLHPPSHSCVELTGSRFMTVLNSSNTAYLRMATSIRPLGTFFLRFVFVLLLFPFLRFPFFVLAAVRTRISLRSVGSVLLLIRREMLVGKAVQRR